MLCVLVIGSEQQGSNPGPGELFQRRILRHFFENGFSLCHLLNMFMFSLYRHAIVPLNSHQASKFGRLNRYLHLLLAAVSLTKIYFIMRLSQ
jgi:hypothetical protein